MKTLIMTKADEFTGIVEREYITEIDPFLKGLSGEEKKELAPVIKQLYREYTKTIKTKTADGNFLWHTKATANRYSIFGKAAFVCLGQKDFEKTNGYLSEEIVNIALDWYCPDWFGAYLEKQVSTRSIIYSLDYKSLMTLVKKENLKPSPEVIVHLLPLAIYERKQNYWEYKPEHLYLSEQTLKEHFWYLFQYESSIHTTNWYYNYQRRSQGHHDGWFTTISDCIKKGELDRLRVLKETLATSTRNFNKTLTGWFIKLFEYLNPGTNEILELQAPLFKALQSPLSKPVNTALKYLKKIGAEAKFDVAGLLENVPQLLVSETKSTVSSTLILLEKVARKHKKYQQQIALLCCQAFIQQEDSLQVRAAKIIAKYGNPEDERLQEDLLMYADSLLTNSKAILSDYISKEQIEAFPAEEEAEDDTIESRLAEGNRIPAIKNIDDLIFLASQAFDNNEPYHFDQLAAGLITFQDQLKGEKIGQLAPAFQRAFKRLFSDWNSKIGMLDQLLAIFFVNYGKILIRRFPKEAAPIRKLYQQYEKTEKENADRWSWYNKKIVELRYWRTNTKSPIYDIFRDVLVLALNRIREQQTLPLLSTPTHQACWIDPAILVERLNRYRQKDVEPDAMDFQIALSRIAFENQENALKLANTQLQGEYLELIRFLLIPDYQPQGSLQNKAAWIVASVTKDPLSDFPNEKFPLLKLNKTNFTGQYQWRVHIRKYMDKRYDYPKRKWENFQASMKALEIFPKKENTEQGIFQKVAHFLLGPKQGPTLIYQHLNFGADPYNMAEHNDISRFLSLVPNNPEPALARVARGVFEQATFSGETDKKTTIRILQFLLEHAYRLGEMAHLFIAFSMISSDRTVRTLAAELWIKGVQTGVVDSILVGNAIGRAETIEFAPLKRLTDLIRENMLRISKKHDKALEAMICTILRHLSEEPIRNLKKLLQFYLELARGHQSKGIPKAVAEKLKSWKKSPSLTKLVKDLESHFDIC